ncbi:hypothetical protein LCGC14_0263170 [marine sediment metagenome]|uniref:Uncharacterized protein n=1 Tax=marine sediment metagenome TaxID=412755 RepID=A0A0F9UI47_9ZZZZ
MPVILAMPDFDLATRSASGFLLRWIAPRVEPAHLFAGLARRKPFQLLAPQSDIIIGTGHGDVDVFTGQNEVVILEVGQYDPREIEGKIIKLLSCQTAEYLGPDLVKNGCVAFLGYTDDYVWVVDADLASRPWADDMAATSLMPVVDGLNALLDGKTAREAFEIELQGYLRNAEVEEDELIKAVLEFNRDNAILLGDEGAKVRARPTLALPFKLVPPPPLFPQRT